MMKNKGFTILEILVVLAVLAILIGMAVPRIKGMQDQGSITKVKSELKSLQTALESYRINRNPNAYPPASKENKASITATTLVLTSPQILSSIMYDPFGATGTTEYRYLLSSNGTYYVVASNGPDGKGASDITIDDAGAVVKSTTDDICVTNGSGC